MVLTERQQRDLDTILYFIPSQWKDYNFSEEDIKMFFEYSEKGKHKDLVDLQFLALYSKEWFVKQGYKNFPIFKNYDDNGKMIYPPIIYESEFSIDYVKAHERFFALLEGKRWRGIHIHEMYEPGILDGSMPYYVILGGYKGDKLMPRVVVDFLKKEMFKGQDADIIETVYQQILYEK